MSSAIGNSENNVSPNKIRIGSSSLACFSMASFTDDSNEILLLILITLMFNLFNFISSNKGIS